MNATNPRTNRCRMLYLVVLACAVPAALGCGTAELERRMEAAVGEANAARVQEQKERPASRKQSNAVDETRIELTEEEREEKLRRLREGDPNRQNTEADDAGAEPDAAAEEAQPAEEASPDAAADEPQF